jgi:hypothetical protein
VARIKITKEEALKRVYDALQPKTPPVGRGRQLTALLDRARARGNIKQ